VAKGLISVRDDAKLSATVAALHYAGRAIQADVRRQTRAVAGPEFTHALGRQSASIQQSRILVKPARITVSNSGIKAKTAHTKRRALSGGGTPLQLGWAFEMGARDPKGNQLPHWRRQGHVFLPTVAEMAPRIANLWTQTTVRRIHESFEGKRA
jgi:hypothetical protein